jgi:hypothetical protein
MSARRNAARMFAIEQRADLHDRRSTPAASARLARSKSLMSYQARMRMPLLIVTGCTGACGNTKRNAGQPGRTSSGTSGAKSCPSAPSPCSHSTDHCGSGPVSSSTVSSRSMVSIAALWRPRQPRVNWPRCTASGGCDDHSPLPCRIESAGVRMLLRQRTEHAGAHGSLAGDKLAAPDSRSQSWPWRGAVQTMRQDNAPPELVLKATPPRLGKGLLARQSLRLDAPGYEDKAVIAVQAPAGFGKTSLLGQWRRESLARAAVVAWLTLDERDEPMRFVQGLMTASRLAATVPRSETDWPAPCSTRAMRSTR